MKQKHKNGGTKVIERPLSSAAAEHRAFWDSLEDHAFFGPSLRHIYFYTDVTDASVLLLRQQVLQACEGTHATMNVPIKAANALAAISPGGSTYAKPIVIHVMSRGGNMDSEGWILSLFNSVHVPLCSMVDGYSASAATALTVMAPYRVATEYSISLLHDYSEMDIKGKREQLMYSRDASESALALIKRLYMARTKLAAPELDAMMRRDMWLDAKTCLRMGICDRIISPDRTDDVRRFMASSHMHGLEPSTAPFIKRSWNRVYAVCQGSELVEAIDGILAGQDTAMKPIVYFAPGGVGDCNDPKASLAVIARILSSPVPVFGVVDNRLTMWQMLPVLFCARRFMYESAAVDCKFAYTSAFGSRLIDIVHNAGIMRSLIEKALGARAKPLAGFVDALFDRDRFLTAEECKKHGMIDEIVGL
jgi:ATP-dependent protease ClpP protease subunit